MTGCTSSDPSFSHPRGGLTGFARFGLGNWKQRALLGGGAAICVVVIDQLSKLAVGLWLRDSVSLCGEFFRLTKVYNPNGVFGVSLGGDFPYEWVSLVAAFILLVLIATEKRTANVLFFGLVLGGALGNLIDRMRWGMVLDFLDFGVSSSLRWPVFNIADSAITIGLLAFLMMALRRERPKPSRSREDSQEEV